MSNHTVRKKALKQPLKGLLLHKMTFHPGESNIKELLTYTKAIL
jgi:hypothetical protein